MLGCAGSERTSELLIFLLSVSSAEYSSIIELNRGAYSRFLYADCSAGSDSMMAAIESLKPSNFDIKEKLCRKTRIPKTMAFVSGIRKSVCLSTRQ